MQQFDILAETSPENNSVAALLGTDSNQSTQWIANIVHELIHVGGKPIDLNFFFDMFYTQEHLVQTKRLFNHYITDPDLNIYAAATRVGTGEVTFQLLKQNHLQAGTYSYPAEGFILFDKNRMKYYPITAVDNDVPFAHKVTVTSAESADEVITIYENEPYLILPSVMVPGYSCATPINDWMTLGYTQQVNFIRFRKDWEVTIDLLRGTRDKAQYAYIYDRDGVGYDAFDLYESKMARQDLRMAHNVYAFIGSPITNPNLYTGVNAIVDADHTGYYGLIPSIQYGGGILKPFAASTGWDWETDAEPIFLYQDSLKRCTKFMATAGLQLLINMDYQSNKLVARQDVGKTVFEAYRRSAEEKSMGGIMTDLSKLAIKGYDYRGLEIDIKKWDSLSDQRFVGSAQWSNSMFWVPATGCTEKGREVAPIEFYQYGNNGWTGDYFEAYVDHRYTNDSCEKVSGYCVQSLAMKMHNPELWVFAQGIADA